MMISITKSFTFDAAHNLPLHDGKCRFMHGHTYRLEVTIAGEPKAYHETATAPDSGMILDFGVLKNIVNDAVLDDLDHTILNEVEWLGGCTTAEWLAVAIFGRLQHALRRHFKATGEVNSLVGVGIDGAYYRCARVARIQLWETPTSYAEVWE